MYIFAKKDTLLAEFTMTYTEQQTNAIKLFKDFIASDTSQVFILRGYAGTGKTTLIATFVELLLKQQWGIQVMAPTGKAAKVLTNKLFSNNITPTTIHKGIYQFEELVIKEKEDVFEYIYPLRENKSTRICIVDEASMISSHKCNEELFKFGSSYLLHDLLTYSKVTSGGKILFVGDPMQLPPVSDNQSCALDDAFFKEMGLSVTSYQLTHIVRQENTSCILSNATRLRNLIKEKTRNELAFDKQENEFMDLQTSEVCKYYCSEKENDAAVICFTNQQAANYNRQIRAIKFPNEQHVTIGDKLMVVSNNHYMDCNLFNGDLITVTGVSDGVIQQSAPVWVDHYGKKERENITLDFRKIKFKDEYGTEHQQYIIETLLDNNLVKLSTIQMKAMYINLMMRTRSFNEKNKAAGIQRSIQDAIMKDEFFNALHVKYGYAFTCHKSQGSEWEKVFVDFTKRTGLDNDSLKWKYTAITRAKKILWCVNLPNITPIMSLTIKNISKSSKCPENALSFANVKESPFHAANDSTALKAKYWSIEQNLNGTGYSIIGIKHLPYRERYELNSPQGPISVDCLYNKAGIFTRYTGDHADDALLELLKNEDNMVYQIDYHSDIDSLNTLFRRIVSLCDEIGITLTNVCEADYKVFYYMKTTSVFASLTFNYNSKGFINFASPLSEIGDADEKLQKLIDSLK